MSGSRADVLQWRLAGVWKPVVKKEDCPSDDGYDELTRYLIRCKGDDPRTGWIAVNYVTTDEMWDYASAFEYAEYLDPEVGSVNVESLLRALKTAREALVGCYNVDCYPADGSSSQDKAIEAIDAALKECGL